MGERVKKNAKNELKDILDELDKLNKELLQTRELAYINKLEETKELHCVSKKSVNKDFKLFYVSTFILISSQKRYLYLLKIEISPVVLHIISLRSSQYYMRYVWPMFKFS